MNGGFFSRIIFSIFNGGNNPVNKLPDPVSIPNLLSSRATLPLTHETEAPDTSLGPDDGAWTSCISSILSRYEDRMEKQPEVGRQLEKLAQTV